MFWSTMQAYNAAWTLPNPRIGQQPNLRSLSISEPRSTFRCFYFRTFNGPRPRFSMLLPDFCCSARRMSRFMAMKAALHSFTLSLRHQLADLNIEVIEVIPPAVDTDLGGPGLHTFGVNLNGFADSVFDGLEAGITEIAYGTADASSQASRAELDKIFQMMNSAGK